MHCRVCDQQNLSLAIDLGMQPWANHFVSKANIGNELFYPLHLFYCHNCSTAQLDYTAKKEQMYANHTYLSGITSTLSDHFLQVAQDVDRRFFQSQKQKSILDIGSNDGVQLKHYQKLGYEVIGVEPCKHVAEIANQNGIHTRHAFFNSTFARCLTPFDVINAAGVFFHLEELHSVTQGIKYLLKEEGIFVIQFLYMKCICENGAFDQIYHEHLLYYTLKTIEALLNLHGLALFDATLNPIHGGSIIGYATHLGKHPVSNRLKQLRKEEEQLGYNRFETYLALGEQMQKLKTKNLAYLKQKKNEGKQIFGMGAPVKGNTLLNYFGIGKEYLDCLVEKNPLREGLYSPGMHLPIKMEAKLTYPPDVYYVLAWNFKNEILRCNQDLIEQGVEFYFPINP